MRPSDTSALAQLAEPLRARLTALLQAAGDKVWIVSGRRSIEEQVQLRRQHCGPSWYDIWQKPSRQCSPPTAIPGQSKHQSGLAADLGGDLGLAERLAVKLGLHSPVAGEAWHFEPDEAAMLALTGSDLPGADVVDDVFGGVTGKIEDVVVGVLGEAVEPLLGGLRRIALVWVLVGGGVALVVLGSVRGTRLQGAI